jgi:acyl carrier protein
VENDTSELKLSWLEEDMNRAAQQVAKWNIKKFDESAHRNTEDDTLDLSSDSLKVLETMSC